MGNDWIDDLKKKDDGENDDEQRRQEGQLHHAAIIRAKAPGFWSGLVETVSADCIKFQTLYPHRPERLVGISGKRENHFVLEGRVIPIRATSLDLNIDGHFVKVVKSIRDEFSHGPGPTTEHINITVDPYDSLVFKMEGKEYRTTQELAKYLFEFVLDLKE